MDSQDDIIKKLMDNPAYLKAYEDAEFLNRSELRAVRLQLELLKADIVQRDEGIVSTIVVFGSARTPDPEHAQAELAVVKEDLAKSPSDPALQLAVKRAEKRLEHSGYYQEAREFARLASSCQSEGQHEFVIVTGGGPGIMEAANRGAYDADAKSIGLSISLPFEQRPNAYITPELCFNFHYFAIRKMHFLMRAKALVACPGGFGTFDELFETLTLIQTRKIKPVPVVLLGKAYWERVINFQALVDEGMISPNDLHLFHFATTGREAWKIVSEFHN